jgi:hypothetical protein
MPKIIFLLILLTLRTSFGCKAITQQTPPTADKTPLTKSIETEPLSVATLEEDSNKLPESLKLASNHFVKADEAAKAPIDALVISRQTLLGLKDNAALKDKLRNVVAQGKILMIQNATNLEMEQGLGIKLSVRSETAQDVLFSGVTKLANGQYLGSVILSPPKEIEGALEPSNVARTVRNEIYAIREQGRKKNSANSERGS